MSTPASMARWTVYSARPEVVWQWSSTGNLVAFLMARTSSYASSGDRSPAMSLMQMESAPMDANVLALATQ